jgi:hypothetical protein
MLAYPLSILHIEVVSSPVAKFRHAASTALNFFPKAHRLTAPSQVSPFSYTQV